MPLLTVKTNICAKDDKVLDLLTESIAKLTGKPKERITVIMEDAKKITFGGTREPCAMIYLESIGAIEGKQKEMTNAVMSILRDHLGVSPARSLIFFNDLEGKNVGHNLTTIG